MNIISSRFLFYLLLVGLSASAISMNLPSYNNGWFLATALFFAIATPFVSPLRNMLTIVLFSLAISLFTFLVMILYSHLWYAALFLFLTIFFSMSAGLKYHRYYFLFLATNVYILFAVSVAMMGVSCNGCEKSILAAGGIAAFWQIVFMPHLMKWRIQLIEKKVITSLQAVSKDLFACFLRPEYADNMYFFERRLHISKTRYFYRIQTLEAKARDRALYCQKLFDILMDMAALRRRVSDYTVFSLCEDEFLMLSNSLSQLWIDMRKKRRYQGDLDDTAFSRAIQVFTNHFQAMLNVAAKEPLAFLLFIASLNYLADEVAHGA